MMDHPVATLGSVNDVVWLTDDEQSAWRSLLLMHQQLNARLARDLAEQCDGLAYQDYVVLVALTDQPDGRLRSNELADRLAWEQSRLSHHINRMSGRGLVEKVACPTDRRGAFVAITPAGRDLIERAAPSHVASVRRWFFDRVAPEDVGAVARVADAVLAGLADDATAARGS